MWGNAGGYDSIGTGGGFMAQSGGGFGSPAVGGVAQGGGEKKRRSQNTLPATVAMILNATHGDEVFRTNEGLELSSVVLVGLVREVVEQPTRVEYKIDDMSGPPLSVKQFLDQDDSTPEDAKAQIARENTYVRVFGHVRAFTNARSVVAFEIRPLLDMNELTGHLLELVQVYLKHKQAQSGGPQPGKLPAATPIQREQPSYAGAQANNVQNLSDIQSQVSDLIRAGDPNIGVDIKDVVAKFRGVPMQKIRDAVDFLSNEGHIYSTIDEDHYAHTDAMA